MTKRIASIDIFRALTMLMMLWVNDFAGMEGIPDWMRHAHAREDMLGLSDIVFPTFLFCMGMSIPHAVESRISKGQGTFRILMHMIARSAALIIMGVFEQNAGGSNGFELLMVIAYFLIWNDYPESSGWKRWLFIGLRLCGVGILAGLAVKAWPMTTGWWGILGLIGWAYLFSAILYLICRHFKPCLPFVWLAVLAIEVISRCTGFLGGLPGGWTDAGLAFSGAMCSCLMMWLTEHGKGKFFPAYTLPAACLTALAAFICHRFWIISKIQGTPTWMFLCIAIDLAVITVLHTISDRKGHTAWARPIKAAGTATLTCYSLPYIWYPVRHFTGLYRPDVLTSGLPGLISALAFAFIIILIAELIGKIGIRMKI